MRRSPLSAVCLRARAFLLAAAFLCGGTTYGLVASGFQFGLGDPQMVLARLTSISGVYADRVLPWNSNRR